MDINYYLIESNRIKVGGYSSVSTDFYCRVLEFLYQDGRKSIDRLLKKYNKDGRDTIYIQNINKTIIHGEKYLVTSENSDILRDIYLKAKISDVYNEFAFVLFILGVVNSFDYLKNFTDVGYVVGRFSKGNTHKWGIVNPLTISDTNYARLMGMYLKNASEGVDYGFTVYDFVYHILSSCKNSPRVNKYSKALSILRDVDITDLNNFTIDKKTLEKYKEEVGILLPILSKKLKNSTVLKILDYLYNTVDIKLLETIINDRQLIINTSMMGIEYNK